MEDERQPPPPAGHAVSKALDADDILIEILVRIGFPTTLVRAALVCKRWLGHVSKRPFLRRFRELHPPRLEHELEHIDLYVFNQVLSKEEGNGVSYFYLYVDCADDEIVEPEYRVHLYALQDGFWIPHHPMAIGQLPHPLFEPRSVLVGNKIYIPVGLDDIIVLDLTSSSLSTIQLPEGVEHGESGTTMLARAADASGVYVIHVEEFELHAWLHKGDNWLLVDIICLGEMCANLGLSDEHTLLLTKQVVYYGDFLFLEMGGCVLHLDIKCRTLRKVYQTEEGHLLGVNPFMMIWPPTFPALKYDRETECEEEDTRKLLGGMQIVSDSDPMETGW